MVIALLLAGCLGSPKDGLEAELPDAIEDGDGDGFKGSEFGGDDCDDDDPDVNPEASDTVDSAGIDDNCDGMDGTDDDGDGYASDESGGEDCDDEDADAYPGAVEVCDGLDNNCDGTTDEETAVDATTWYADADGDGYGDDAITTVACTAPDGYVAEGGDCDDSQRKVSPAKNETPYNGIDDDCDPSTPDDDVDGDGYDAEKTGGEDCDDKDATRYPGAAEDCDDFVVNDCDSDKDAMWEECGFGTVMSLKYADLKLTGEADYDWAGTSVSGAGDVDGDGLDDLLIGTYSNDASGEDAGAAYLLLGGGALGGASPLDLADADGKFTGEVSEDFAGSTVSAAGDVDGDGLDDVLVGAYRESSGGLEAGAAYLLLGGGALGGASPLDLADADRKFTGEASNDYAGAAVSSAGDVDGDGLHDLVIGAYQEATGGANAGAAYLLLSSGALGGTSPLDLEDADGKFTGEASNDYAGAEVSSAGDVDGDGLDDILIGAPDEGTGGLYAGAAYLLLGGSASPLDLADADGKFTGESSGDSAGWSVSSAGDMDGDGLHDILIGAPDDDTGGGGAGAAYLLLGGGALAGGASTLDLSYADTKLIGEVSPDCAGWSVADAGDVDSDGLPDLLIGARWEATDYYYAGAAYLLLGGGALAGGASTLDLEDADLKLTGENYEDFAGSAVSGAGDVNGDGFDDLLVGAYRASVSGRYEGAAYLIFGGGW